MFSNNRIRHLKNHSILKAWSAAKADHLTEPGQQPVLRPLHRRLQVGSGSDLQKKRYHLRRQQKQIHQQEHTLLQARTNIG